MATSRKGTRKRLLGWSMMLLSMVLMLASIFASEVLSASVAVPLGAMLLVFALVVLGGASSTRAEDDATGS